FEKFYRAKYADFIQGSGLGLYITKKMITTIGGKIDFESVEGNGSTFYLTIPASNGEIKSKLNTPG
ncbi:MAG: sensor histidine kinase, partial [Bacteroidia bacterium]